MCLQVQFTSIYCSVFVLEKELSNCPSIFRNTPKGKTQTDKFNFSNQIAFLYHMTIMWHDDHVTMFGKFFLLTWWRPNFFFNSPRNNLFQNIIYIYSGIFVTFNYFVDNGRLVHFTFEVVITQYLPVQGSFERPKSIDRVNRKSDDGSKKEMNLDRTRTYNIRRIIYVHSWIFMRWGFMRSTNNILKLHWFTNPV